MRKVHVLVNDTPQWWSHMITLPCSISMRSGHGWVNRLWCSHNGEKAKDILGCIPVGKPNNSLTKGKYTNGNWCTASTHAENAWI